MDWRTSLFVLGLVVATYRYATMAANLKLNRRYAARYSWLRKQRMTIDGHAIKAEELDARCDMGLAATRLDRA